MYGAVLQQSNYNAFSPYAGFQKIGGYDALVTHYMHAMPAQSELSNSTPSTCGAPRADAFHIFRDPVNSDNPWPGLLLQSSLGCMWYWCCDQVCVICLFNLFGIFV